MFCYIIVYLATAGFSFKVSLILFNPIQSRSAHACYKFSFIGNLILANISHRTLLCYDKKFFSLMSKYTYHG